MPSLGAQPMRIRELEGPLPRDGQYPTLGESGARFIYSCLQVKFYKRFLFKGHH
jgi:hypothetical protein